LPLVIGALVLRALIPVGFMPGPVAGLSLVAMMCAAPAPGAGAGEEIIEVPGGTAIGHGAHCGFCGLPLLGVAFAFANLSAPVAIEFHSLPGRADAPQPRFALERAQIPRAPPLA
jgi:hypothetical protein